MVYCVVHIVSSGSRKPHLQDGAMAIFELCVQHSIKLETDLIPSSLNTWADFLSGIVDYGVDSCIFDVLEASWGPHFIDYFASSYSTLLSCFHSRFWL